MSVSEERAGREDLPEVFGLLRGNGLPTEGLEEHAATTLVAREPLGLIGSAALELYGTAVLQRSVAGRGDNRGRGQGCRLTGSALDPARRHGATCAYLLTETADGFFPASGSASWQAEKSRRACEAPSNLSPPVQRAPGRWPCPWRPRPSPTGTTAPVRADGEGRPSHGRGRRAYPDDTRRDVR